VLEKIRLENTLTRQLVEDKKINVILSDHRYGCYHQTIPSFFLTHQIRFIAPGILRPFEFLGLWFNQYFHKKYTGVIIPDYRENGQGQISGRLSKLNRDSTGHFCGILSSVTKENYPQDIDAVFAVSGPEPQRTVLEELLFSQIDKIPGKKALVLGKPEKSGPRKFSKGVEVYEYATRSLMQNLFNRSRLIIARSGYSTLMEILELRKKALFIPTPGQTEQVYLAKRLEQKGYFYGVSQDRLNLAVQIPEALKYQGFPGKFKTEDSVKIIFELLSETLNSKL
jgi:UDP-N-acetylglucosamine transferase subunit ALG13